MKYIAIVFLFIACAQKKECKHIYVAIKESQEPPLVEAVDSNSILVDFAHYGEYVVCVKCLHQKRQIVGYGDLSPKPDRDAFFDSVGRIWVRAYPGAPVQPLDSIMITPTVK